MATDKKISYINQDGYKNYIKNSDSITIPKKFKARKKAASTHLAYITKAEAAQLKKQNKGTPHKGPKGIPSYDDYDASAGGYGRATSGQQMSRMESRGGQTERDRADARSLGYTPQEVADIRGGAQEAAAMGQRRSGIGGLLGGIGRGVLGFFGGIPGKVMSGILSAKNFAKRTGTKIGEEVEEFSQYPTLDRYLNRNTDKYKDKPYRGQGHGYDFSDTGNNKGLFTDTLGVPIGPGKRVGQDQGYYGMGSQYDPTRVPDNLGTDNQFIEEEETFNPNFLAPGSAEGGRVGLYAGGDPEEPAENIFEFMRDQNIPMSEQVEAGPTEEQVAMVIDMDGKGMDMETISSITQLGKETIMSILGVEMAQGGVARLL